MQMPWESGRWHRWCRRADRIIHRPDRYCTRVCRCTWLSLPLRCICDVLNAFLRLGECAAAHFLMNFACFIGQSKKLSIQCRIYALNAASADNGIYWIDSFFRRRRSRCPLCKLMKRSPRFGQENVMASLTCEPVKWNGVGGLALTHGHEHENGQSPDNFTSLVKVNVKCSLVKSRAVFAWHVRAEAVKISKAHRTKWKHVGLFWFS